MTAPAPATTTPTSRLGVWVLAATGVATAFAAVAAMATPGRVERLSDGIASPSTVGDFSALEIVAALGQPVALAAVVLTALWMGRLRLARIRAGLGVDGPIGAEWWGWLVPGANLALPALAMRALTKGAVPLRLVLGWWIPLATAALAYGAASVAEVTAFGLASTTLDRPARVELLTPLMWIAAVACAAAWVMLVPLVRKASTTVGHPEGHPTVEP